MTERHPSAAVRGFILLAHYGYGTASLLTWPLRAVRRRPRRALVGIGLLVLAAAGTAVAYARYQWTAAQDDLGADRPQAALARLRVCLLLWPQNPEVHLVAARAARLS